MRTLFPPARLAAGLILLMFGLTPKEAEALWIKMSLEELVRQSDLIVIGELVSLRSQKERSFDLGRIRIEEVILGKEDAVDVILAVPSPRAPLSSTSILYKIGQRGLWFLRRQTESGSAHYLADHPQRLQPEENVRLLREYLQRGKHGAED